MGKRGKTKREREAQRQRETDRKKRREERIKTKEDQSWNQGHSFRATAKNIYG